MNAGLPLSIGLRFISHMRLRERVLRTIARVCLCLTVVLGGMSAPALGRANTEPNIETVKVANATISPTKSTIDLISGHTYRLVVNGTVSDWCAATGCPNGNPTTTPQPNVGQDALYCYALWRCPTPQLSRQLLINGVGLDQLAGKAGQIPFSPTHSYTVEISGLAGPLTFLSAAVAGGQRTQESGSWTIQIIDLTATPTPTPQPPPAPPTTTPAKTPQHRGTPLPTTKPGMTWVWTEALAAQMVIDKVRIPCADVPITGMPHPCNLQMAIAADIYAKKQGQICTSEPAYEIQHCRTTDGLRQLRE